MNGKRLLRSLSLKNILSFGPEGVDIELQPLNVLIGPNGSGKSNFLEALRLLKATTSDLTQPISKGGGINEWLWKGEWMRPLAEMAATVDREELCPIVHQLNFSSSEDRFHLVAEYVSLGLNPDCLDAPSYYEFFGNQAKILAWNGDESLGTPKTIPMEQLTRNQSILLQRTDPDTYPELNILAKQFREFAFYSADLGIGRATLARHAQSADLYPGFLFEDGSNLALVLNDLDNRPNVMRRIVEHLQLFSERAETIKTRIVQGAVQINIQEKGLSQLVPASRLSDGTLRFLCLLTILLHPEPPPLVCIEEPELGMHPDIIKTIADLLQEAATRTQLIVTTHSDILVSNLSDVPECLIVCDATRNGTTMRHLDLAELESFPADDMLGDIWMKGAIGGTRW